MPAKLMVFSFAYFLLLFPFLYLACLAMLAVFSIAWPSLALLAILALLGFAWLCLAMLGYVWLCLALIASRPL
jgi:hypothetical protein